MEIMRWKIVDTARPDQLIGLEIQNTKNLNQNPKYKNTQRKKSEWKPSDGNNEMKDSARPA